MTAAPPPVPPHEPREKPEMPSGAEQMVVTAGASPDLFDASHRLQSVRERIRQAARRSARDPASIRLIAVSKTWSAAHIVPLIAAGQRAFGENRIQESLGKWPDIRRDHVDHPGQADDLTLDLVGQLQRNKAEAAVSLFDTLHAVDRPGLVEAIAAAQRRVGRRPACFLQLALDGSGERAGAEAADLPALLRHAQAADLFVVGVMAVAPLGREPAPWFAFAAEQARRLGLPRLSLGMSGDFETAIAMGATDVRVGSALFGPRMNGADMSAKECVR